MTVKTAIPVIRSTSSRCWNLFLRSSQSTVSFFFSSQWKCDTKMHSHFGSAILRYAANLHSFHDAYKLLQL